MVKLLKDVEFKADGNIVADYAQEINIETADIVKGILSSLPSTSNVSWVTSPTNFAYWYVSGDHINLVLNLSSIINKIMEIKMVLILKYGCFNGNSGRIKRNERC